MELGLREWLIIGGVIVVLLIVLDGWRRMRGSSNRLKMKIDKSLSELPDLPEESSFNPELPGGGARVVNDGDERLATRQEPVLGDAGLETTVEPEFNELNLSAVRQTTRHSSEADTDMSVSKPAAKSSTIPPVVTRNRSTSPVAPQGEGGDAAKLNAAKPTVSVTQPLTAKPAEHGVPPEHDPLFAPSDSFPPHHDGPSFDEVAEGVSAVRVVPAEALRSGDDRVQSTAMDTETGVVPDSDAPPSVAAADDIPLVQHIVKPTAVIPSIEQDNQSDIDDMFALDEQRVPDAEEVGKVSAYTAEDDNLIDSLPDAFQLRARDEEAADDDEHEFDYTRPVSELMRPKREDDNQLQQTMMDLPEYSEKYQPSADLVTPAGQEATSVSTRDNADETQRPAAHFSAVEDEAPTELVGLFTDEQPVAVPARPDKPAPQSPAAQTTETAKVDRQDDPAIGIKGQSLQKIPEADKVLVISVVASEGESSFSGRNLLQILLACGMRYGDMKIFHRYEDGLDKGAIQFSMTNALEPGYFDIDTMDSIETRGVTFFMSMEEPRDVMNAYECMLATASAVANNLHGVLLDENRSTMRDQTKEHYRERIRKFEMRKLKKTTTA